MRSPPLGSIQLGRWGVGIRYIGASCSSRAVWFEFDIESTDCLSNFFYHSNDSASGIKANGTVTGRDQSFWGIRKTQSRSCALALWCSFPACPRISVRLLFAPY